MGKDEELLKELHWLMDFVQTIDVGLVAIDEDMRVRVWNSFMENHSDIHAPDIIGKSLFDRFPDLPRDWLEHKLHNVFELRTREFLTWEQRPYLFRFKCYRPFTGMSETMYQNVTLIPLLSSDGEVHHVGIIVYDVTDIAVNRIGLQDANGQLQTLSRTDALTQLNNRGFWEECLSREVQRVHRTGRPASLVMFDIDHFKKVNDSYGHQAGDAVIQAVAETVRNTARGTDVPGRYGGEEFGVILIDTVGENATVFAERLRKAVEKIEVKYEDQVVRFTISLGIAQLTEDMTEPAQWLQAADAALYESKHNGRNRVTVHRPGMEPAA